MKTILIALVLSSSTLAYPIPVSIQSSSSFQCLAVILSLLLFVSVLLAAKHVYVIRRRTHSVNKASSISSLSSNHSNSSFLSFSNEKTSKSSKLGFLVGFFGSPTWETRLNVPTHPFRYSLLHYLRSSLNRSRTPSHKSSLYEFGERRPYHARAAPTECTAQSSTLCASRPSMSPQAPTYPSNVYLSRTRRYSLPTGSENRTPNHQRKRHSSLGSRGRKDSSSTHGLSALNAHTSSPRTSFFDFSSPPPSSIPTRTKQKSAVKHTSSAIPPLPPLPPTIVSPLASELPFEDNFLYSQSLVQTARSSSTPTQHGAPPTPKANTSLKPLCQTPRSATLARQQNIRTPSTRSKKTPPIGPSPLRIVTLPEMSISEFGALSPRISSHLVEEATEEARTRERQAGVYPSIGMGYPSSWGDRLKLSLGSSTSSKKERCDSSLGSRRVSKAAQDEAEEVMLEIIRDLVEETSGWDTSLHMEDSFKSLIQNAGITPQNSRDDLGDGEIILSDDLTKTTSVATRVEIDLGLLELDPYRMQCIQDAHVQESGFLAHGMPLMTLEEEGEEEEEGLGDIEVNRLV
ncbi:hypothetical protein PQX77_000166 [Marasmius sp. AFHP31]|nr:hypothetical protein PQX77_000166 [Marasmius sp. AFHP31]